MWACCARVPRCSGASFGFWGGGCGRCGGGQLRRRRAAPVDVDRATGDDDVVEQARRAGVDVDEPRWRWEVTDRGGLTRLDDTQNEIIKTAVTPFSVGPAVGAPVSVLIASDELDDPALAPDRWAMATVGARIARHGDLLVPLIGRQQHLLAL